jgi:hypothetical protein
MNPMEDLSGVLGSARGKRYRLQKEAIMLRRLCVVCVLALLLAPAISQAQFKQGDWELTLSGQGSNGPDFNGFSAAAAGNLGYFLTDALELGVRQTISYTDIGIPGSALNGSTAVAADWNFDIGRFVPYIGGSIGFVYGDAVSDSWFAGPEGGLKYFVNNTTFIFLSVQYQFFFNQDSNASDAFSDGQFLYGLGIGFRF